MTHDTRPLKKRNGDWERKDKREMIKDKRKKIKGKR
jgi:hypothetical protein